MRVIRDGTAHDPADDGIRGGQGRTDEQIRDSSRAAAWAFGALLVLVAAICICA